MTNIQSELYDKCMKKAEIANINDTKVAANFLKKKYGWVNWNKCPKRFRISHDARAWIDLHIMLMKNLVTNLDVIDALNIGYVPEYILVRKD